MHIGKMSEMAYVAKKWDGLGEAPGWRRENFSWVMEQLLGLWGDCPPQEGLPSRVSFKKPGRSYMRTLLAKNMSSAAHGDRDKADSGLQVSQVGLWEPHADIVFERQ